MRSIFRKSTPQDIQVLRMVPGPAAPSKMFRDLGLRHGMWVNTSDGVGIVTDVKAMGSVEVMLTDDLGENRLLALFAARAVKQAALNDIPEPRRPSLEIAQQLGYV